MATGNSPQNVAENNEDRELTPDIGSEDENEELPSLRKHIFYSLKPFFVVRNDPDWESLSKRGPGVVLVISWTGYMYKQRRWELQSREANLTLLIRHCRLQKLGFQRIAKNLNWRRNISHWMATTVLAHPPTAPLSASISAKKTKTKRGAGLEKEGTQLEVKHYKPEEASRRSMTTRKKEKEKGGQEHINQKMSRDGPKGHLKSLNPS